MFLTGNFLQSVDEITEIYFCKKKLTAATRKYYQLSIKKSSVKYVSGKE